MTAHNPDLVRCNRRCDERRPTLAACGSPAQRIVCVLWLPLLPLQDKRSIGVCFVMTPAVPAPGHAGPIAEAGDLSFLGLLFWCGVLPSLRNSGRKWPRYCILLCKCLSINVQPSLGRCFKLISCLSIDQHCVFFRRRNKPEVPVSRLSVSIWNLQISQSSTAIIIAVAFATAVP
ncbi:hypothetical protein TgHK011_006383 [Trichoderma gracile]|nr:hypothetical protein TgHK011_006383 [Trichoderma gracile]